MFLYHTRARILFTYSVPAYHILTHIKVSYFNKPFLDADSNFVARGDELEKLLWELLWSQDISPEESGALGDRKDRQ